jgi:hypothetical protein
MLTDVVFLDYPGGALVNVLCDGPFPDELAPYAVDPDSPRCRWAEPLATGLTPHYLVFPDADTAARALATAGWTAPTMEE